MELLGIPTVRTDNGDVPGYQPAPTERVSICHRTVQAYPIHEAFLTELLRLPFPTLVDDRKAGLRGIPN